MTNNKEDIKNAETEEKAENVNINDEAEKADNKEKGQEKLSASEKKKVKKLEARIAELEKELASADEAKKADEDKYLRMLAEYDNFRRRAAKEKDSAYTDAYADVITAILPVLDNLDRAVGCKDAEGLSTGLAMTLKGFSETLSKLGVEEIKADGEAFDPNFHNAVMHIDDESLGEGQIVEVFQKGFKKGDKVIRHAVVKVAN